VCLALITGVHRSASENIYLHLSALQSIQEMFLTSVPESSSRFAQAVRSGSDRMKGDWGNGQAEAD
jgi:hypothetical protein